MFCVYFKSVFCVVFSLCYVWCLDASNPRKRVLARFARCGRFAAAAAASRPQAISTNIIVFVVRGLTFVNVVALDS